MMKLQLLAISFFVVAFIISFHQYLIWGQWFEWKDVHHELFISAAIFAGILLILVSLFKKRLLKESMR